jgi:hypothetical protein
LRLENSAGTVYHGILLIPSTNDNYSQTGLKKSNL